MESPNNIKKIALCGMFIALAVVMGYVESFIYIPFLLPGMKLGLANCVILFVLLRLGIGYSFFVSFVRILIINSLFGNAMNAIFSIAGAVLSIIVMYVLKRIDRFSTVGISIAGGVAHNFGQVIVAIIIFNNLGMIYYFPMLIIFGLGAGIFVGIVVSYIYKLANNSVKGYH